RVHARKPFGQEGPCKIKALIAADQIFDAPGDAFGAGKQFFVGKMARHEGNSDLLCKPDLAAARFSENDSAASSLDRDAGMSRDDAWTRLQMSCAWSGSPAASSWRRNSPRRGRSRARSRRNSAAPSWPPPTASSLSITWWKET